MVKFYNLSKVILTITDDGKVDIGENMTPTQAAKEFLEIINNMTTKKELLDENKNK